MSFSSNIPGLQNQLSVSVELPRDLEGLRDAFNDLYQDIASTTNTKVGGVYVPIEKLTSAQYFIASNPQKNRAVYRMVVDFGALPNTTNKSVAHNISGWNNQYRLVQSYGGATDPTGISAIPVPNDNIFLEINATNVIITTTADYSAYTETTVVIEYTKTAV